MKLIRRIALSTMLAAAAVTSYAGCLQQFRDTVAYCEGYTGGFSEIGCRMDAHVDYYRCLGRAATS